MTYKIKTFFRILGLKIKKMLIFIDQKNVERVARKLINKSDYLIDFGIGFSENEKSVTCELFRYKNKRYIYVTQEYQKNGYEYPGGKLERVCNYRFSLYKNDNVQKSVGDIKVVEDDNLDKDKITYYLHMTKIPFVGIFDRIRDAFMYNFICVEFKRSGDTGNVVVKTDVGFGDIFCKGTHTNTREMTKIEALSFMRGLDHFVTKTFVHNYDMDDIYPYEPIEGGEIELKPFGYEGVRQIDKRINELKGEKKK